MSGNFNSVSVPTYSRRLEGRQYCVWCGALREEGHNPGCALTQIEKLKEGRGTALGRKLEKNNVLGNMALKRMEASMQMHNKDGQIITGPVDEEDNKRLSYEIAKFMLYNNQKNNPEPEKTRMRIRELAEPILSEKELAELFEGEPLDYLESCETITINE